MIITALVLILLLWYVCFYPVRAKYKVMYAWRTVLRTFGICPHCHARMSRTGTGRPICTNIDCGLR